MLHHFSRTALLDERHAADRTHETLRFQCRAVEQNRRYRTMPRLFTMVNTRSDGSLSQELGRANRATTFRDFDFEMAIWDCQFREVSQQLSWQRVAA